jgi:hypothetical protein
VRLGWNGVLVAAAAVAVLVVAAAIVDFRHTEQRVPPVPPLCVPDTAACNAARNAQFGPRLDRIEQLEREYRGRAWLYSSLLIAAVAVTSVAAIAGGRPPRRVVANLGAVGVGALILAVVVVYVGFGLPALDPPTTPVYAPPVVMLLGALVGTALTRGAPDSLPRISRGRAARGVLVVGWSLAAVTVLLAWLFGSVEPGCGSDEQPPSWHDALAAATLGTALAGIAVAVAALVLRRWIPALTWVLVAPAALLYVAASSCAFS